MMGTIKRFEDRAITVAVLWALLLAAGAPTAQAEGLEEVREFHIEAQALDAALIEFSEQSDLQLMVPTELVAGRHSPGISGEYAGTVALAALLDEYGLSFTAVGADTVAVSRHGEDDDEGKSQPTSRQVLMAQNQASAEETQTGATKSEDDEEEELELEHITVTGTRIKGIKDQFSPVTQISREEMDLAGFNNVSDIFESLPQNFGGGVTIVTSSANTANGPGNAGVNLRGLGNAATLVLVNGRRLAAGGSRGQFVDISTIPASAIDRVDVLTDGASAIYGSDAIAGVVNIILRDDYEGAETRINVGTITDGGGNYLKAGQTLGWRSDRAHAIVTYEYSKEEELDSKQKDFAEDVVQPTWLLPETEKHSLFASTGAQLSDRITLYVDGFFNDRKSKQFTSRDALSSQNLQEADVQQYGGALGLDVELTDDWEANLSGSYSKSDAFSENIRFNNSSSPGELFSNVAEILSFDATIGGPLFNITDDPVKVVVGGHYRSEEAKIDILVRPQSATNVDKSRDVFAAFGEIYAPIISESNRIPGIESLAISVSARYEDFDDIGSSLVPKVGLAWSPITGLNLRGTYGQSFRAPRLDQLIPTVTSAARAPFLDPMAPDGVSAALLVTGVGDDLGPEEAESWTAGFDFAPEFLDGLLLRVTYFDTVYSDRLGTPSRTLDSSFRIIDFTGIPIRDVSQEIVQDLCARTSLCVDFADFIPSLDPIPLEDVEVLLDLRLQNLSLSKVEGFDFDASYSLSSAIGDWRFSLAATLLTTFEQRLATLAPVDDLLNTFANPVDLKMRGGVQWRTGSMTTSVFINHVGNYLDDEVPTGAVPVDSFTTVDATIRLDLGQLGDTPLTEGTSLSFSAINLLNEDPPRISAAVPFRTATFDAANANPAGRKIGILLTKQF